MDPTDGKYYMTRLDELKQVRRANEQTWSDIAEWQRPIRQDFFAERQVDTIPDINVYDGTALTAVENFKGGMFGYMTNPANVWFELTYLDKRLMNRSDARQYLAHLNHVAMRSYSPSVSDFYEHAGEVIADAGAFGSGIQWQEPIPGQQRFLDIGLPISECYLDRS